jgi:hypothetical protein
MCFDLTLPRFNLMAEARGGARSLTALRWTARSGRAIIPFAAQLIRITRLLLRFTRIPASAPHAFPQHLP